MSFDFHLIDTEDPGNCSVVDEEFSRKLNISCKPGEPWWFKTYTCVSLSHCFLFTVSLAYVHSIKVIDREAEMVIIRIMIIIINNFGVMVCSNRKQI